mmetsp:Transcript_125771/g.391670  ORF Transcript_125771/g.391670 Transcript_125771/m.391670 type:complete len:209 (+) Transcript_125771:846-1472(+)
MTLCSIASICSLAARTCAAPTAPSAPRWSASASSISPAAIRASSALSCHLATSTKMLSCSQNCTEFMTAGVRIMTTKSFADGSVSQLRRQAAAHCSCGAKASMRITMINFMQVTTPNQEISCTAYLPFLRWACNICRSLFQSVCLSCCRSGCALPPSPGVAGEAPALASAGSSGKLMQGASIIPATSARTPPWSLRDTRRAPRSLYST